MRPMEPADLDPAAAVILRGGWGDRRAALGYLAGQAGAHLLLAERDGLPVGTAAGGRYGDVGWVGLVFVAPAARSAGLGRALASAVAGRLERDGCRALRLTATELARPTYERLGFAEEAVGHAN